jgi:flagellar M-ring protein FliF
MDFLNKGFAQVSELFRSMTPGARITAGLLSVLVVISLGYLFQHQVSGPDVFLMHGEPIPGSCLPAMEAAFDKAHLTSYAVEGDQIKVPRGQQAAYMAALVDGKALPPNFGSALTRALDSGSMFESPDQRRQRTKAALQEELSLILRSMNGVENAFVLFDSEPRSGLGNEKLVTASVSVKPVGSENLDESKVSAIRYAVAAAIAGLKPENVTVTDLGPHGRVYHGDLENGGAAGENQYLAVKEMHERALKAKILDALSKIPGVAVEVTVDLDKERSSRTESVKVDPKTVNLRSTEKTQTKNRDGTSSGGRPGFQAQGNGSDKLAATAAGKGSHEEEEVSTADTVSEPVTREHTEKESVGLTPKRATVAVVVPSSYFEKVWRERNPVKEGEEPKTPDPAALDAIHEEVSTLIRKHVATILTPMLPPEPKPDMTELVTVTPFQDLKPSVIPGPSTWQNVLAWLGSHWSTLGLIGLVLAGLAMLRSVVRGGGSPEPATMSMRIAATPDEAPAEKESAEVVAARRLRRLAAGGPSLRDELSDLVTEDPDAAANILRNWIGQAG